MYKIPPRTDTLYDIKYVVLVVLYFSKRAAITLDTKSDIEKAKVFTKIFPGKYLR